MSTIDIDALYASLSAPRPVLVVISGPSGVGKDATVQRMRALNYPFYFVVTATTRPRRPHETEGVDYYFVSKSEFADMIERNELLEYAIVYGDYKGIPKRHIREALASGRDVVLRIDVQGAATIRRLIPQAVTIFLAPESEADLIERLSKRQTESPDELKMRIATARKEILRLSEFDYVVVNRHNHLDDTVEQVLAILRAEKCRTDWEPVTL